MVTKQILFFVLFLSVSLSANADKYRAFNCNDGSKIQAYLESFSPVSGDVRLEMSNGDVKRTAISDFSERDQAYIRECQTIYEQVRVSLKKRTVKEELYHGVLGGIWQSMFPNVGYEGGWRSVFPGIKYKEVVYEVTVENQSRTPCRNVKVEYCIYHQTTVRETQCKTIFTEGGSSSGWYENGSDKKLPEREVTDILSGTISIKELPGRAQTTELTSPVRIIEKQSEFKTPEISARPKHNDVSVRSLRTIDGTLLGIRYRVFIPTASGDYAMLEFSDPSTLTKETDWVAPKKM